MSTAVQAPQRLSFIDSHTAGEPTRVILDGFPELPGKALSEQRLSLSRDFDDWRQAYQHRAARQ